MNKIIKYFFVLLALCVLVGVLAYFARSGALLLAVLGIITLTILGGIIKEQLRRKKEGYYAYTSGGAQEGVLIYNEGGKILQLYFSQPKDTIYIPTDPKWKEIMPDWARERKDEIVTKIKKRVGKRLIGKGWTYEESDREEHLLRRLNSL
ncbi:MAG TPA: hypothetical protein VK208_21345 [Pyrinomonadaceae bacterium]|nr:hypothetical protein [Pyrinomonadaceae bacterium]